MHGALPHAKPVCTLSVQTENFYKPSSIGTEGMQPEP